MSRYTAYILFVMTASVFVVFLPQRAEAYQKNFCFKAGYFYSSGVTYQDQSVGNEWSTPNHRPLKGLRVYITNNGSSVFNGYASPSDGCTGNLTLSHGTWRVYAWSYGKPVSGSNRILYSREKNTSTGNYLFNLYQVAGISAGNGTQVVDPYLTNDSVWSVYAAAAHAASKEPYTPLSESTPLSFNYDPNPSPPNKIANTANPSTGPVTFLYPSSVEEKFTIAHELGHQYSFIRVGHVLSGTSDYGEKKCSQSSCPTSCKSEGSGDCYHKLTSKENMTAAFNEAWANFFAALAWNTGSQCEIANPVGSSYDSVDCDQGTTAYPQGYMATVCEDNCGTNWGDVDCESSGVELDWTRVLWNTNRPCSNNGSLSNWLNLLEAYDTGGAGASLNECNIYTSINNLMTGEPMESCWDTQVVTQRVRYDYSSSACGPFCPGL